MNTTTESKQNDAKQPETPRGKGRPPGARNKNQANNKEAEKKEKKPNLSNIDERKKKFSGNSPLHQVMRNENLIVNPKGDIAPCESNIYHVLMTDPRYSKIEFRLNSMNGMIDINGEPLQDSHIMDILIRLQQDYNMSSLKKNHVKGAISNISNQNEYHPIQDYLDSIDNNKYTGTLDLVLSKALKINARHPQYTLYSTYIRRWLISAVSRIKNPGEKVDTILVLGGAQGLKKSTFFRTLAGDKYFNDSLADNLVSKDAIMGIHSSWIIELGELSAITQTKNMGQVKQILTVREDKIRLPYADGITTLKRSSIFCATENPGPLGSAVYRDDTGGRRFWLITLMNNCNIDIDWLQENRDNIWSDALYLYRNGEQHWLTSEEELMHGEDMCKNRSESPVYEKAIQYITDADDGWELPKNTTSAKFYELVLGKSTVSSAEQRHMARALEDCGYVKVQKRIKGIRVWVWNKVEDDDSTPDDNFTDTDANKDITTTASASASASAIVIKKPISRTGNNNSCAKPSSTINEMSILGIDGYKQYSDDITIDDALSMDDDEEEEEI